MPHMITLTIKSKTYGTHNVLLDDEDYERVMAEGKWNIIKSLNSFYAVAVNRPELYLHRFLTNLPSWKEGLVVEHINKNGLDNRKENLRVYAIFDWPA
jgi:hypothetical protein